MTAKAKFKNLTLKVLFLGVGLAIAMILIAKVCFEMSYDSSFKDVDRIYRIRCGVERQGEDKPNDYPQVSGGVAPGFKNEIPGVEQATRFTTVFESDTFVDKDGNKITADHIMADSSFFDIFSRPFLAGDAKKVFKSWSGEITVSRSFAEKLGGVNESIGKTIFNESVPLLPLTVSAVYEDYPKNCTYHPDIIGPIQGMGEWSISNWVGNDRYQAFVKLAKGVDPSSLKDAIRKMQETHQPLEEMEKNGMKIWYTLDSFSTEHRTQSLVKNLIVILSIVAFLLLLISVLNYLLVAISDVIRRSKEVGVRKCYGAGSWDIHRILIKETAVNLGLSLLTAALLILAFRGSIESLVGVSIKAMLIPQTIWLLAAIVVVVFLVSALIPAGMFLRIPISSAFRGYKESKRRWKLSLLAFQFVINAILVSLLLVVSAQYRKSVNEDVGYDCENLFYQTFSAFDQTKMTAIVDNVRRLPCVSGAELTYTLPFSEASGNNIYLPGDDRELFNVADEYLASQGFFTLMGFHLLEGNPPAGPKDVAVSKSFVDEMSKFADWSDGAVGKSVAVSEHSKGNDDVFTICGVYQDYIIGSAINPDHRPSVRFCGDKSFFDGKDRGQDYDWSSLLQTLVVKLSEATPQTLKAVNEAVKEAAPDSSPELASYSEKLKSLYDGTNQMKKTYTLGAFFALLIAVIGLIGYVRDENYRRSAEIAVRKVNGARSGEIVRMLVMSVMKIAVAAVIVGDICAWFIARLWLEQFPLKVSLNPLYFIAADVIVLVIVVATIVVNSLGIGRSNPVDSLKNE